MRVLQTRFIILHLLVDSTVIITSLLTLPYCIYAFAEFSKNTVLSSFQMVLWTVIGIVLTVLSLFSAFFCMGKFQRWEKEK